MHTQATWTKNEEGQFFFFFSLTVVERDVSCWIEALNVLDSKDAEED